MNENKDSCNIPQLIGIKTLIMMMMRLVTDSMTTSYLHIDIGKAITVTRII